MRHISTRRATVALAAVLAAAGLPLVAPVAPADAADACLSEVQPKDPLLGTIPIGPACDDTVAPTTALGAVQPGVSDGWVRSTSVTIAFTGKHTDADADPIGFQCQFFNTPSAPTTWKDCTSPFVADKLDQNTGTAYTFRVRAVDTADNAHDITTDPMFAADTDLPDYDATPAELVFRADVTAPNTFGVLRTDYYDEDDSAAPMVTSPLVQVRLQSSEGRSDGTATYQCRLNDRPVACNDGITTLRALSPGLQRFTAAAVDPAGNVDPSPFEQQFFVPRNLTLADVARSSTGDWRAVRSPRAFAGECLQAKAYGATVSFPVRNIKAIRLLAPAGPGLGKVQVRVGRGAWTTVNLASPDAQGMKIYQVREELSGLVAGPLQIRVVSKNKPVRIDAVMAR